MKNKRDTKKFLIGTIMILVIFSSFVMPVNSISEIGNDENHPDMFLSGKLTIAPEMIDLGALKEGDTKTISFEISNTGIEETLTIAGNAIPTPPIVSDIKDQNILSGETFDLINLNEHISDEDTATEDMTWSVSNCEHISIDITDNTATIKYPADWNGSETVTFTATDPTGLSDSDTATFTITPKEEQEDDEQQDDTTEDNEQDDTEDEEEQDSDNEEDEEQEENDDEEEQQDDETEEDDTDENLVTQIRNLIQMLKDREITLKEFMQKIISLVAI